MTASVRAPDPHDILHASCAAFGEKAVLIRGASGSGKSALTLELLARGANLVADDRTCLRMTSRGVIAYAPHTLLGLWGMKKTFTTLALHVDDKAGFVNTLQQKLEA